MADNCHSPRHHLLFVTMFWPGGGFFLPTPQKKMIALTFS
jgi:hypothetical protein